MFLTILKFFKGKYITSSLGMIYHFVHLLSVLSDLVGTKKENIHSFLLILFTCSSTNSPSLPLKFSLYQGSAENAWSWKALLNFNLVTVFLTGKAQFWSIFLRSYPNPKLMVEIWSASSCHEDNDCLPSAYHTDTVIKFLGW